jgi:DNA-directed RNA polymerase alpha subunit
MTTVDSNPRLALSIDEMELTVSAYDKLTKAGITTLGALAQHTETSLRRLHVRARDIREIRENLSYLGLDLGLIIEPDTGAGI